ncbi:Uu.00g019910.m01.CDS01 [Anthostomella pinea]|uniref:diacylglycerol O-acyltransferase n=1 Tax=Anthostomella pinea TaxID=933095 RepID=A0AAI8VZD2_9PEZI|nr:Uu.00g019910.m01.CDS01 [Anthostomella pinea]
MADEESSMRRQAAPPGTSGSSKGSRLPRRGHKRRSANVPKADPVPDSRRSSQPRIPSPEAEQPVEQKPRRGKDYYRSHRRDTSSVASQDSYLDDLPSPRTPPPTNRAPTARGYTPRIIEDDYDDFPNPESLSLPRKPSSIPGAPPSNGSPRKVYKRKGARAKAQPEMAEDGEKDRPRSTTPEDTAKHSSPEQAGLKEESDVNVSEHDNAKESTKDSVENTLHSNGNGYHVPGSGMNSEELDDEPSQVHDGVTYSDALKTGLESEESDRKGQDDDDSYPELDDMSMEEIHRPPLPSQNGTIRWAPWNVPFKRRGQTLVLLLHSLCIGLSVSIFFALCANPFAWPLLLIYLLHVLSSKASTDGSLRYRSEWFRKSYLWHLFAGYFPAKLHKTHDLPPTRKYIFGYHPHGIISHGAWAAFATDALGFSEKFPGITNSLLTLDSNFRIPFYREYVLGMGVRSVSKESIVNILTKGGANGEGMGRGVTVVIGGARESLEAQPGTLRLILKERKGFIKVAVRCGADLVPVLAFGENNLYDQLRPKEHPVVHKIQMFVLKVWKFTLPFLHGRGVFNYDVGLMPYRRPLNIVVGAPIKVRQSNTVETEEINRLHGLYVAELEKLWDTYKDEFALDRREDMQILS